VKKSSKKEIPINHGDEETGRTVDDESTVKPGDYSSLDDKNTGSESPPDTEDSANSETDEVARLTELWQRERASFANYRRRVEDEKTEIRKYALHDLACELVNILDYFDSSFSFAENLPDDARNVILGVKYTVDELMRVLSTHGISPIQVEVGDKFDSNLMEVVRRDENAGVESGTIIEILRRGWTVHDRVLRASQVVVCVTPDDHTNEGGEESGNLNTA